MINKIMIHKNQNKKKEKTKIIDSTHTQRKLYRGVFSQGVTFSYRENGHSCRPEGGEAGASAAMPSGCTVTSTGLPWKETLLQSRREGQKCAWSKGFTPARLQLTYPSSIQPTEGEEASS